MHEVPAEVQRSIFRFRYRERFHLSVEQMENEPWEALWEANLIWSLDSERDTLENKRREASRSN